MGWSRSRARAFPQSAWKTSRARRFRRCSKGARPRAMTRSSSARAPCAASTGGSGTRFGCRSMVRPSRCASSAEPSFPSSARGVSSPPTSATAPQSAAKYFVDSESPPGQRYSVVLIRLRAGADVAANTARLTRSLKQFDFCGGDPGCVKSADPPGDISNYGRIQGTTYALAAASGHHGHRRSRAWLDHVRPTQAS